jgi:hypothetical protein
MLDHADWVTDDPLGIGGLLTDACRVQQLTHRLELGAEDLALRLVGSAFIGLRHWAGHTELRRVASERLAFRELGLCIGLHAVEMLREHVQGDLQVVLEAVARFVPLAPTIEAFWIDPKHRGGTHRDIDDVMLATSLLPGGFLRLSRADHSATAVAVDASSARGPGAPVSDSALREAERSSNLRPR